ncbi:MAG: hypothetical protein RSA49_02000 [Anaerovoracaceae bacterium]
MRNIQEKFMRFMYGRYGVDQLYYATFILYLILLVLNLFLRSSIISILITLAIIWTFFRFLSRNIPARRKENEKFLNFWDKFAPDFKFMQMRMREFKTHAFHKCPYCSAVLRLPRKRGKFPVTCPKCNQKFNIRNWF